MLTDSVVVLPDSSTRPCSAILLPSPDDIKRSDTPANNRTDSRHTHSPSTTVGVTLLRTSSTARSTLRSLPSLSSPNEATNGQSESRASLSIRVSRARTWFRPTSYAKRDDDRMTGKVSRTSLIYHFGLEGLGELRLESDADDEVNNRPCTQHAVDARPDRARVVHRESRATSS